VFAPVTRMKMVQMFIAMEAQRGWYIYQNHVKLTFLHDELSEDVYVEHPRGW